jgi:hypothetical protein
VTRSSGPQESASANSTEEPAVFIGLKKTNLLVGDIIMNVFYIVDVDLLLKIFSEKSFSVDS